MATISALGIGSGLDLNGLLDQLEVAERQKLAPITKQKSTFQGKISAYGTLTSALTQFQTAANKLNTASLFSGVKNTVSGDALSATTRNNATAGSFQIEVNHLARASSAATAGIADKGVNLGAGTVNVTLGNGESLSIDIGADHSSLENIRDTINAADGGVRASIVNDGSGSPYRLVLAATQTGTDGAITAVDFGALGATLALDAGAEVTARNASLTVNGIAITSQSNQVEDAIEGVTLNLKAEGEAILTIARDSQSTTDAVKGFVTAYNSLQTAIGGLSSFNAETGAAGDLLGDATLRSVQSRVRAVMTSVVAGGEFQRLADIGISLQLNGSLKLDEDKLDAAVKTKPQALADFFAGDSHTGGLAGQLGATLSQVLTSGGVLDNATRGLDAGIKRLDARYLRMEESITATIARYRTQFAQLDSMIATMNSTSSYLNQQFEMMNAQLNAK